MRAAATGGPVLIGGDDLTDHGGVNTAGQNEGGWLYIQKGLENIKPRVTRANDNSVAALGSSSTGGGAGEAITRAASAASMTVTYHDGAAAIELFFSNLRASAAMPAILWIAGTGASNDLNTEEGTALQNNATTIADFVSSGGGLFSHGSEFGWLSALLPVTAVDSGGSGDLYLTPEGRAAFPGLTDADLNSGPWHSHLEGNFGGTDVLVRSRSVKDANGNDAAVVIGGASARLTTAPEPAPPAPGTPPAPAIRLKAPAPLAVRVQLRAAPLVATTPPARVASAGLPVTGADVKSLLGPGVLALLGGLGLLLAGRRSRTA